MPFDFTNAGATADQPSVNATYTSSMLIEELTALSGQRPRAVTLQGPGLPFQGAEWGGKNAIVTEWYSGNGDEATQQDLGPEEAPSSWQGKWARTMMGKSPSLAADADGRPLTVVDPETLAEFLEEMFRGGARLRVTWSQGSESPSARGKKVREGRASSWSFKYTRMQDIEWSVTFDWQSRGTRVQTVTSVRNGQLEAAAAAMNLAAANLASQIASAPFIASNGAIYKSATQFTLGQLESLASGPSQVTNSLQRNVLQVENRMKQVVDIAKTLESQPQAVSGSAVSIAKSAISLAIQFVDQIGELPVELMSTAGKGSVHDLLRGFRYFAQTSDAAYASALAAQAVVRQLQLRAAAPPGAGAMSAQAAQSQGGDMITIYVAKEGDTPARLSMRFYGNMDHGVDILQANRLPWHQPTFPKGKPLFIPRLKAQQKTS